MKLKILNIDGKKTDTIDVSDKVINLKVNHKLIKSVIDWQLNHLKFRRAKTKQRNEIKGSTRKIYAQKGTGGARHSSRKAPLFVGGGVAHGPKGAVYKIKKINNNLSNALIVSDKDSEKNINKSARNIKDVKIINHEGANIYDLMKFKNVILTLSSIKKIESRILNEKN